MLPQIEYKGYSTRLEYSTEDLEGESHKATDDNLAFCEEIGKEPQV